MCSAARHDRPRASMAWTMQLRTCGAGTTQPKPRLNKLQRKTTHRTSSRNRSWTRNRNNNYNNKVNTSRIPLHGCFVGALVVDAYTAYPSETPPDNTQPLLYQEIMSSAVSANYAFCCAKKLRGSAAPRYYGLCCAKKLRVLLRQGITGSAVPEKYGFYCDES